MKFTDEQLHTLRHMLGINTPNDRSPRPFRNHAAVVPGDKEYAELGRLGAVEQYQVRYPTGYTWYRCTQAGKLAAMRSHRVIRRTKSQRRYSAFLNLLDSLPELTFNDFLTKPAFKEVRENA